MRHDPPHYRPLLGVLALLLAALVALAGCDAGATSSYEMFTLSVGRSVIDADDLDDMSLAQTENHDDPHGPLFAGNFAPAAPAPPDALLVVSYNLRYGEAVAEAIRAYREVAPLPAADIILLQEMDEAGAGALARELGYNYVYYPASVAVDGDNFGNAILARWPIREPHKLILPRHHPVTGQQRTATRAVVDVAGTEVLVYSTHIETATAPPALRAAQFQAILDDIPDDAGHVIIGGDFNTVTRRGVANLARLYADHDLAHNSDGLGPTFTRFGMRPSATDHIFSRGFEQLEAGVLGELVMSDHFPVWVRLEWKE